MNCYCKMVQWMVTPTNHVFVSLTNLPILRGALALGEFRNIFLPSIAEDQKKVLQSEHGAPHVVP